MEQFLNLLGLSLAVEVIKCLFISIIKDLRNILKKIRSDRTSDLKKLKK
jgi:hypothetical protein